MFFTVTFFTAVTMVFFGGAAVLDGGMQSLAADMKAAIARSGLTLDYVARTINYPIPRLSDQLNGKEAFTSLCRIAASRELRDLVWPEFLEIQAARLDRALVKVDMARLLSGLDELFPLVRRQLKASLRTERKAEAV